MTTPNTAIDASIDASAHGVPRPRSAGARVAAATAGGALIGLALGLFGGPIGLAVGACLGGALGALAERAIQRARGWEEQNEAELDATIGVSGGDIGAPPSEGSILCAKRAASEAEFFSGQGLSSRAIKVLPARRAA
jgi:hypothetical protein